MSNKAKTDFTVYTIARGLQPHSGDLAPCWRMVVRGTEHHMLSTDDIDEVIRSLHAGEDYIADELGFEFIDGRLRVRMLGDAAFCSPSDMLVLLNTLKGASDRSQRDLP